jgi:capsular exopolysaccharide synthesis family protein
VAVGVLNGTTRATALKIATRLVVQPGTPPAYIESLNQLFANLALVSRERPLKVIVFTSPLPGDGKTLTAINFALVGASRGLRMLLIDADLRRGLASSVLECPGEPGLSELLGGTAKVSEALRRVTLDESTSLMMVPSGALPKEPGRLLTLDRVRASLGTLAPSFDVVVIDTPPINLLADATLLASAADAVLLVVRAGRTQAADLRYAMDQLEATHAPVLGTILNDIDLRRHAGDDDTYKYIAEVERYHTCPG